MNDDIADAVRAAATVGDVPALQRFVASNGAAAVRADTDAGELTNLHWAAAHGQVEVVRFLLAPPVSADPTAARVNNFTPLHSAAMEGHAIVCKLLLDAGASVNVQTAPQGYSPLHSAAFAGHIEAIKVLMAHGADLTARNYRKERPYDTARRTGQAAAANILIPPQHGPRLGQMLRTLAERTCGLFKKSS